MNEYRANNETARRVRNLSRMIVSAESDEEACEWYEQLYQLEVNADHEVMTLAASGPLTEKMLRETHVEVFRLIVETPEAIRAMAPDGGEVDELIFECAKRVIDLHERGLLTPRD